MTHLRGPPGNEIGSTEQLHKRSQRTSTKRIVVSCRHRHSTALLRPQAPSLCTPDHHHHTQQSRHNSHGQHPPPHNTGSGRAQGAGNKGGRGGAASKQPGERRFFFIIIIGSHEGQDQKVRVLGGLALPVLVGKERQKI